MIEMDDDEIERLIEEELRNLDTLDDLDYEDEELGASKTHQVVDEIEEDESNYKSSITEYLEALKYNEKRSEVLLQGANELIINLESYKIDTGALLEKKLKDELDEENEDVLCICEKVLSDIQGQEKEEEELMERYSSKDENENKNLTIIDGADKASIIVVTELENKAKNELKALQQEHEEQKELQKKIEEKRQKEEFVFEIMRQEKKQQYQQQIKSTQETNNQQQKVLMKYLKEELQNKEEKLKDVQSKYNELYDEDFRIEQERLLSFKKEIRKIEEEKKIASSICIQKTFRKYWVQKKYLPILIQLKEERLQKEREEKAKQWKAEQDKQKLEQTKKDAELRARLENERLKKDEERKKKEMEEKERKEIYDKMKMKAKEDYEKSRHISKLKSIANQEGAKCNKQPEQDVTITNSKNPSDEDGKRNLDTTTNEQIDFVKEPGMAERLSEEICREENLKRNEGESQKNMEHSDKNKNDLVVNKIHDQIPENQTENKMLFHELSEDESSVKTNSLENNEQNKEHSHEDKYENKDENKKDSNECERFSTQDKKHSHEDKEYKKYPVENNEQFNENKKESNECENTSNEIKEHLHEDDKDLNVCVKLSTENKEQMHDERNYSNESERFSSENNIQYRTNRKDSSECKNFITENNQEPYENKLDINNDILKEKKCLSREKKGSDEGSREDYFSSSPQKQSDNQVCNSKNNFNNYLENDDNEDCNNINEDSDNKHPANTSLNENVIYRNDDVRKINLPLKLREIYEEWREFSKQNRSLDKPKRKNRVVISASDRKLPSVSKEQILSQNVNEEHQDFVLSLRNIKENHKMDTISKYLPKLKVLDCQDCSVPHCNSLDDLHLLQAFYFKNCSCSNISLQLKNLKILDVSNNRINSLHGLNELKNLMFLNASKNKITRILGIESCKKLQYLVLDDNRIIQTKGLRYLSSLISLSLRHNNISELSGIDHCQWLLNIDLTGNNLSQVPSFTNNVLLTSIILDENEILNLDGISSKWLPLLSYLSIQNNSLSELSDLSNLVHLRGIDLKGNFVSNQSDVINTVKENKYLSCICLGENPVTDALNEIFSPQVDAILVNNISLNNVTKMTMTDNDFSSVCMNHVQNLFTICTSIEARASRKIQGSNLDIVQEQVQLHEKLATFCQKYLSLHQNIYDVNLTKEDSIPPDNTTQSLEITDKQLGKDETVDHKKKYSEIENEYATLIQATYRGYRIRKVYLSLKAYLDSSEQFTDDVIQNSDDDIRSDFDYNEEINLADFDAGHDLILDWKPASTPRLPTRDVPLPKIDASLFDGGATKTSTPTANDEEIKRAWGTPSTLETPRSMITDRTFSSCKSDRTESSASSHKNSKMAEEWGFQSSRTAELMQKRAKKLGKHLKKKKLDPKERYELFKKIDSTMYHPQIDTTRRKPPNRQSYFDRYASPRLLEDEPKKPDDLVFSWVCNQTIVHRDRLADMKVPTKYLADVKSSDVPYTQRSESTSFPQIDSSILAGKPVTLVQSEIHNPKPPSKEKPRSGHSRRRKNTIDEERDEIKSHSAPSGRSIQSHNEVSKEDKWKHCAYR